MALNRVPSFQEVKDWANSTLVTSVNGSSGDVSVEGTPSGVISMWSGTTADVPDGWTLCDGTDGTPDLRGRFIVGAGGAYSVGQTGGEEQVTLTESELPSHSHKDKVRTTEGGRKPNYSWEYLGNHNISSQTTTSGSSTGGDEAHENRPPYYALAFIMKV